MRFVIDRLLFSGAGFLAGIGATIVYYRIRGYQLVAKK